jgi:hypothetical protein
MRGEKRPMGVNRIPYFKAQVKKVLQSVTSASFKRRARNINIEVSNK